jgi:hypothetical protein
LVNKIVHPGRVFRWLLLFQEFEFEVIVQPIKNNKGSYDLPRVKIGEKSIMIDDDLLDAHFFKF